MFSFRYRNNKALCLSDNCFINNKNAKYTKGSTKNIGSIQFFFCKRNLQKILNKTIRNASPPLLVLCRFWYFENHCSVKAICPK